MRGGARPGAGRKRKTLPVAQHEIMSASINPGDWVALMRTLYRSACHGNTRAADLLFRYAFGKPGTVPRPIPTGSPDPDAASESQRDERDQ